MIQGSASFAPGFLLFSKLGTDSKIHLPEIAQKNQPTNAPKWGLQKRDQTVAFLLHHFCGKEEIMHRLIGKSPLYLKGSFHFRFCRISSINSICDKGVCVPILHRKGALRGWCAAPCLSLKNQDFEAIISNQAQVHWKLTPSCQNAPSAQVCMVLPFSLKIH